MKGGVVYMRDIKQLESFDVDPNHLINSKFIFNNKQSIDYEWMEKQIAYINNLSEEHKYILRAYTIYGDKFINNYLRGSLTDKLSDILLFQCEQNNENPFLFQHLKKTGKKEIDNLYRQNILEYIAEFIGELNMIILNSPKLTKRIKVFRGLSNGDFIVDSLQYNDNNTQYIKNSDYLSTTFYVPSVSNFINGDCCILELILDHTTPCIFTTYISRRRNEFEITIFPNVTLKYRKCTRKYLLDSPDHYETLDVFLNPKRYDVPIVRMCEFTVHKS